MHDPSWCAGRIAGGHTYTTVLDQTRMVGNGRFIRSAKISAGIDAALYAVAQLHGLEQVIETATYMEYGWHHRTVDGSTIVKAAD